MNAREFVEKVTSSALSYPSNIYTMSGRVYTCVNPYSYHIVKRFPQLYENMDGLFVDGMTMCWWIKWLWGKNVPRLSFDMTSMAADLFERLNKNENSQSIFFVGARQEQLNDFVGIIKDKYPHINICGFRNGYFKDSNERQSVINMIVNTYPDYVIVGMGSPLQEQFVFELKKSGFTGIAFTCGGFFHQTSKGVNYYPEWINRYNLRAFYRLYKEKGLFKRLYNVLIEFPILFTRDTVKTKILK